MIGSVKSVYLYIGWAIAIGIGCPSPLSAQRSLWQKLGDQGVWGVQTNALYDALLIPNIGVTYGFGTREELFAAGAVQVFDTLEEVEAYLDELEANAES